MAGYRLPRGGTRVDRSRPLRFTFDGASVVRPCRRHGRLGAARLRAHARRPLLQVSPPARRLFGRLGRAERAGHARQRRRYRSERQGDDRRGGGRDGGAQPERLAVARQRFRRRQRPVRAVLLRRLLLQDLHRARSAAPGCSTSPSSAAPRASARRASSPTRTATRRCTPSATCWSWAAGRPGSSAALAAGRAGARVILCDDAARCSAARSTSRTRSRRRCRRTGCSRRSLRARTALPNVRVHDAHDRLRLLRRQRPRRVGGRPVGRGSRQAARQRHWRMQARRVVLAAGALERPFVFPGNDTPGVMLASAGARLCAPLRRCGRARGRRSSPTTMPAGGAPPRWSRRACRCARWSTRARMPAGSFTSSPIAGTQFLTGQVVTAANGGKTLTSRPGGGLRRGEQARVGRSARAALRRAARLGRLEPARASRQPGRRAAGL